MAFLTPFFLVGLGAIALPVLIHLIQRERKRVIEFPSLMFVRRIPYQSVRRRRIRHWALLLMRAAAIALIVAAFARPFLRQGTVAGAGGGGAPRRAHPSARRPRGRSRPGCRSRPPLAAARARSSSCSINPRAW